LRAAQIGAFCGGSAASFARKPNKQKEFRNPAACIRQPETAAFWRPARGVKILRVTKIEAAIPIPLPL
jgi:hypothetical protein